MLNSNYRMCIFKDTCPHNESCAFLHVNDINLIRDAFYEVKNAFYTFQNKMSIKHASVLMRHIHQLNNNVWQNYSTKKAGRKIMSEAKRRSN
jgi:hypothetical protein